MCEVHDASEVCLFRGGVQRIKYKTDLKLE